MLQRRRNLQEGTVAEPSIFPNLGDISLEISSTAFPVHATVSAPSPFLSPSRSKYEVFGSGPSHRAEAGIIVSTIAAQFHSWVVYYSDRVEQNPQMAASDGVASLMDGLMMHKTEHFRRRRVGGD